MEEIKLGTIVGVSDNPEESFQKVKDLGIPTCQLACIAENVIDRFSPVKIRESAERMGIEISSCFLLFEGQVFNLKDGPRTMGFVPLEYRERRLRLAKRFSDWVKAIGVPSITSHVGFIPDDENDPLYKGFIELMKEYTEYCVNNNQIFCFETGQELPSTLMRTIQDIGKTNLGINLDPANLIMYGMANPLDAVEIFGEYVRGMHAKDGLWPNREEYLGLEVPLGEGRVNFSLLIPRLKAKGFRGPITIEREITGPQQKTDILRAIEILKPLL
ncbi:MAG TPA: sugar phosphate isomerase/epimerase [Candidatus Omnitrophica bacterium]|nr:sugar phosphate isomerase/epimerase [Candidatus Omnitrophota bacterium]